MERVAERQPFQSLSPSGISSACSHRTAYGRDSLGDESSSELIDLLGESHEQVRQAQAIRGIAWCMVVRELYERSALGAPRSVIARLRHAYLEAFNERMYASFWIGWYERLEVDDQAEKTNNAETRSRSRGKPYR